MRGERSMGRSFAVLAVSTWLLLPAAGAWAQEEADPAEITIGERLFLETRFARFFAVGSGADVNAPLPTGDPAVDVVQKIDGTLPGPFAGQSSNCRACHFVDELLDEPTGGMRTYSDFARRSPLSARADGLAVSARNAQPLVNASLARSGGLLLHFDGEFASMEDLVRGTLAGRNFGWVPGEAARAVAHVARVIRGDDGSGGLAQEFGGSYARVLTGTDPTLPPELTLPAELRVDVANATDQQLFDAVAALISQYTLSLVFAQGEDGAFNGSPFDLFLAQNGLPAQPADGESPAAYTERLRQAVAALADPVFVDDGPFEFQMQQRVFGPEELRGLQVFLAVAPPAGASTGVGNCSGCHQAPSFTDFSFHNTGVSQLEYDGVHGAGQFAQLRVPGLLERQLFANRFLPATEQRPRAREPFRRPALREDRSRSDLGVWNIFANGDFPAPQPALRAALCNDVLAALALDSALDRLLAQVRECTPGRLLGASVARFKTPGLRDLNHSTPFMHNGAFDDLRGAVRFYQRASELARSGALRNGDRRIQGIRLSDDDVESLVRFLAALNEDYS